MLGPDACGFLCVLRDTCAVLVWLYPGLCAVCCFDPDVTRACGFDQALTPEEILRLPDQQRKSGPGGGGRGMIKGRGGLERLEWRKREGMASIQDRKRDNDGNDGGATEKQRGRGGGGGKRGKGGHRPDPATRDKADS
eukprot:1138441-Rhodomonas_salina.2